MNQLSISIKSKSEIEKFLLINIIGLMNSLKEGLLTIEECEIYLYSPYTIEKLRKLKINKEVINLIEEGCELEDIESLVPEKLEMYIDNLKTEAINLLIKLTNEKTDEYKKWID